jgi:hypothetical protein
MTSNDFQRLLEFIGHKPGEPVNIAELIAEGQAQHLRQIVTQIFLSGLAKQGECFANDIAAALAGHYCGYVAITGGMEREVMVELCNAVTKATNAVLERANGKRVDVVSNN